MALSSSPVSPAQRRRASQAAMEAPLFGSLPETLAFAVLCAALLASPLFLSGFWPVTRDYWPQSLALLGAVVACLLLALSGSRASQNAKPSPLALCLLGFVACNLASLLAASYKHDAILEVSRLAAALAWFPIARRLIYAAPTADESAHPQVLADHARRERLKLCAVIASAAAGTLVPCAMALLKFAAEKQPQMASFYNTNLFAFCVAMSLPLCAAWWLLARPLFRSRIVDVAGIAGVLLGAAGLLISASKGGLLAGACGAITFVALAFSARRQAVASTWRANRRVLGPSLLVAALLLGGLGAKTVLPRLQRAAGSESHSTVFRAYTWRGTLDMAMDKPVLGHGPGSFPTDFPRFQQAGYTRSAHQSWLQIAAESGWPSLLFLLGAIGCGLARARKYLQDKSRPHRAWVGAGGAGALVAALVHGMMDAGWGILSIAILLSVCLSLLDAPRDLAPSNATDTESESRPLALGWLLAMLPLALAASYGMKSQSAENARVSSRELAAMSESQRAEVAQQAKAATEDSPGDARAWANLALLKEAAGDTTGAAADYRRAWELQPGKALYPRRLAELFASDKSVAPAREFFDKAIALDPKDTGLHLERARFLAQNGDAKSAREDYERILELQDGPLGKYPATPEIVNGDFNRARLALAQEAQKAGDIKQAQTLAKRGLDEVEAARESARVNKAMIEAVTMYGEGLNSPKAEELDEQERAFKSILAQK